MNQPPPPPSYSYAYGAPPGSSAPPPYQQANPYYNQPPYSNQGHPAQVSRAGCLFLEKGFSIISSVCFSTSYVTGLYCDKTSCPLVFPLSLSVLTAQQRAPPPPAGPPGQLSNEGGPYYGGAGGYGSPPAPAAQVRRHSSRTINEGRAASLGFFLLGKQSALRRLNKHLTPPAPLFTACADVACASRLHVWSRPGAGPAHDAAGRTDGPVPAAPERGGRGAYSAERVNLETLKSRAPPLPLFIRSAHA